MNKFFFPLLCCSLLAITACKNQNSNSKKAETAIKPHDVIPFFQHWNLILGDGSNVGQATDYENKDFFYTARDGKGDWVVFKTPNAGNTHGTSNNTRDYCYEA